MKITVAIILLSVVSRGLIAEPAPITLPDPLTLDYAISLAEDKNHPDIFTAQSVSEQALSEVNLADSNLGLQIDLELEAAVIEPSPLAINQNSDDHSAILRITKPLYDFGQTVNKREAAEMEYTAAKNILKLVYDRRRIDIARSFFEVILSDLKYSWDTESTVTAFVHNDSVKDRHALGEVSDVELLKASHEHQILFQQRAATESQQRITRAMLAESLNLPGVLSSNLKRPRLQYHKKALPEYDVLLDRMMNNNLQIKQGQAQLDAAHKKLQAARYQMRPKLSAEIEVSEYSRDSISNEDWRAALNLSIPLFEHDGIKAEVSRQRSNWLKQRAMLLNIQSRLRQRLYELWQNIHVLKSERQQLQQSMDYRELELDRSRALYEMEVKTNLGNAMAATSEMRYRQAVAEFKLALTWMELLMLLNEDVVKGELTMNEDSN
jgi:outer membrane protein TolC